MQAFLLLARELAQDGELGANAHGLAESRIGTAHAGKPLGVPLDFQQSHDLDRQVGTDPEDAEALAVHELERRIPVPQLGPELLHPEAAFADIRVVEEHDGSLRELGLPGLEVVPYGFVRMETVDVEQVDRAVLEVRPHRRRSNDEA